MNETCRIFNTIERIRSASYCNVCFLGASLTVAAGVGNSVATSWRRLFTRYIYERFHHVYHCQPSEIMGGIGAMESFGAVFTVERNILQNLPVLVFLEFCVNDRGVPDKDLIRKSLDGIIRQIKTCKTSPDVVLLGAGCRKVEGEPGEGLIDHAIHKEIADHYGLSFLDIQGHIYKRLEERGQTWDDVSIIFEEKDPVHLNDYGNYLWFEAMRDWFDEQWQLYEQDPTARPNQDLPAPFCSDEFQSTKLIDPSRRNKNIKLEGSWEKKDGGMVPWYFDNVFVGRPGDKLTLTFNGTAVGAMCLLYCNGLKIEAKIDGEEVVGPYTNFGIEFGKFFLLKHGMENKEHVLELEVANLSKRQNKLEDPTAQIGYLGVATG